MPLQFLENEINNFLLEEQAEVLCISGQWGVGKTYQWDKILKNSRPHTSSKYYSYVSLFGVNSIDDLQLKIFSEATELPSDNSTLFQKKTKQGSVLLRKTMATLKHIPKIKEFSSLATSVAISQGLQDLIVCIDDLERMGEGLRVKDIFGLISELKERKNCKVVVILNDNALEAEARAEFDENFEKIVDKHLKFSPSVNFNTTIAFPEPSDNQRAIIKISKKLNISNIRILKKINHHVTQFTESIGVFDQEVMDKFIGNIGVFCWCKYSSSSPDKGFLETWNAFTLARNEDAKPEHKDWSNILVENGVGGFGEIEKCIYGSIDRGFYTAEDIEQLTTTAKEMEEQYISSRASKRHSSVWDEYFHNFSDNSEEITSELIRTFHEEVAYLSPKQLSDAVWLLRGIQKDIEADELVDFFIENKERPPSYFRLDSFFLGRTHNDEYMKGKFEEKSLESELMRRSLFEVLDEIAKENHWSEDNRRYLSKTSVDEFYEIFTSHDHFRDNNIVKAALWYKNVGNAGEREKTITENVILALKRIASESPIQKLKVEGYIGKID